MRCRVSYTSEVQKYSKDHLREVLRHPMNSCRDILILYISKYLNTMDAISRLWMFMQIQVFEFVASFRYKIRHEFTG